MENLELEIEKIEAILEAVLFTMGEAVDIKKLALAIDHDEKTTRKIVRNFMDQFNNSDRGIKIIEIEDSFQMCTKPEMYEYLIKVVSQPKKHELTEVVLETLSIIAYKQPVTRLEIEKIRGVSSDHSVNKLLEYNLVEEVGRLEAPGRPLLFGTTDEFLRQFGVKSIDELPIVNPESLEEFKIEAQEEIQLKLDI